MNGSSDVRAVFRLLYLEGLRIGLTAAGAPVVKGGQPSPALRERLQTHREQIIANVTEQGIGMDDRRYVVPAGCIAERACARLGWCGQALTRRTCDHSAPDREAA